MAVAVLLQSLRLLLPLPPLAGAFIIGTLVNMKLALTMEINGFLTAWLLACLLPFFAYLQGQLPFPFLIPVVMLGNIAFVYLLGQCKRAWPRVLLPPLGKAVLMCVFTYILLGLFGIDGPIMRRMILFSMSVPQFATGVLGVLAADKIYAILKADVKL